MCRCSRRHQSQGGLDGLDCHQFDAQCALPKTDDKKKVLQQTPARTVVQEQLPPVCFPINRGLGSLCKPLIACMLSNLPELFASSKQCYAVQASHEPRGRQAALPGGATRRRCACPAASRRRSTPAATAAASCPVMLRAVPAAPAGLVHCMHAASCCHA